jgi:calcium/calmodulin-dependent 3',5'-cyclic nucleotide phosphodiesterase
MLKIVFICFFDYYLVSFIVDLLFTLLLLLNNRRTPEEDDDLSEVRADAVPPEVRAWLASTFTRQISSHRKPGEEKPKFRSVAQAIRAGILVERIYRRMSSSSFLQFPAEVARNLKVHTQCAALYLV